MKLLKKLLWSGNYGVIRETMTEIEIIKGDITILKVDAIVNAANRGLIPGGGVDGAIHKAAGPELKEYCKTLNGCLTGQSKITSAYNLPSKYIIHTVGPVWLCGLRNEAELLKSCYITALNLAKEYNIKTIAFPAISCGRYHFPLDKATKIAINTIQEYIKDNEFLDKIIFIDLKDDVIETYKNFLKYN